MIPRIIHYCWFGGRPLPKSAQRCINSWRRFFPDWEIREWNEDNFDVNVIPYTAEAYSLHKYAYVSDYARFVVLEQYGGVYFDTDVEVIRPFDDILERGAFMGIEVPAAEGVSYPYVAPGLGLAVEPHHPLYKRLIAYYNNLHYIDPASGVPSSETIVKHTTRLLIEEGLQKTNTIQKVSGISIYPMDFFNPLEDATGKLHKTVNTHSIHWYDKSWIENYGFLRKWSARLLHRILGVGFIRKINPRK